jgi:hypothetical protein
MRALVVVFFIGLMNVAAFAQADSNTSGGSLTPGFKLNDGREYTQEEKERMKANEDAAKAARAKIPDAKANSDPWASARTADAPAPKVKPKTMPKQ